MRRSLVFKLTLAFLLVSLIGVALVAVFSGLITAREFDRLSEEQARSNFSDDVSAYYRAYGSWDGVARAFRRRPSFQPPPGPPASQPPGHLFNRLPRLSLVDLSGRVVIPAGRYKLDEHVSDAALARGTALIIDGQQVGTILPIDGPPPRDPLEEQYLIRTNRALLIAAVGATVAAVIIGLVLARTLTHPLRELTVATQAVARGELEQKVPIRSADELGQLAASFNRMSADLARAHHLRRQMTADIAHDLRTPLTVITGYLEALRDGDLQPTPARFEAMYDEAKHLKQLVEDLRTLSLADAGELTLNRQSTQVRPLLERVANAYGHQASRQDINLAVQTEAGLPQIEVDPERMVRVLSNLVSNALRYTPEGGRITLSGQTGAGAVRLEVRDSGPGIPPEELPHIFERFYRADRARQQAGGESGLGLAIVRAIVEAHGGQVWAESRPGQGATFMISLPIRAPQ